MAIIQGPAEIAPVLAVDPEAPDLFRGRENIPNLGGSLFGGQVLAQSLNAATQTVADRPVHSLHAYFLRRGRLAPLVSYKVEITHEGRSFSTRRVTALQAATTLFHMECSFHTPEPGFHHEEGPALTPPDPETLPGASELAELYKARLDPAAQRLLLGRTPLEIKFVEPERLFRAQATAVSGLWMRVPSAAGLPAPLQACALAYISDAWLVAAVAMRHGAAADPKNLAILGLDHAIWFHAPAQVGDWLYYELDSPWSGNGRGLARGRFFDRRGRLIASVAQEGLFRRMEDRARARA
jgi:acyl-CoA thioesterase II